MIFKTNKHVFPSFFKNKKQKKTMYLSKIRTLRDLENQTLVVFLSFHFHLKKETTHRETDNSCYSHAHDLSKIYLQSLYC